MAPTGAGKTEAAVLPAIDLILEKGSDQLQGIRIIYITPLRALNRDMIKRLKELCKNVGISIAVRHGDTSQSERARQAKRAPVMLITTPETLQSILPTKYLGAALKNVRCVIIDEIHELYGNKRGAQLSIGLERLEQLSPGFQRIGISATIGNIEYVGRFLSNNKECKTAVLSERKQMSMRVEMPLRCNWHNGLEEKLGIDNQALSRIKLIADSIAAHHSTLIFVNTRQVAEALASRLIKVNALYSFGGIGVHHGSLDKIERESLEEHFKNNAIKSIVATSSLELGIDIGTIDLVVQYGSPRQALRLVQRVGRSGHTQHAVSKGLIVATGVIDAIEAVAVCENALEGVLETTETQTNALDVLANQICGITLDKHISTIHEVHGIVTSSFVYCDLTLETLHSVLEFMTKQSLIGFDGNKVTPARRTRLYYYEHISVIPDSKRVMVKSALDNRIISSLDQKFVASALEDGTVFITKGLPWRVVSIEEELINVEPSTDTMGAIPDWSGEDIPVSYEVAQSVFKMLSNAESISNATSDANITKALQKLSQAHQSAAMPSTTKVVVEESYEHTVVYVGMGTMANEALARLLAQLIVAHTGNSVRVKASPYAILIETNSRLDLVKILSNVTEHAAQKILLSSIAGTELFIYKFITVAKLFGIIEKKATVSKSMARRLIRILNDTPVYHEAMRDTISSYLNIEKLMEFIRAIHNGTITIQKSFSPSLSPLGEAILDAAYYTRELITPVTPNSAVLNSFSNHVFSKSIELLCTHCGFRFTRSVNELKDLKSITCPSCKSRMISVYSEQFEALVEKRKNNKALNQTEKKALREMLSQAEMLSEHGGRAITALSVYGIGTRSASRALMMLHREEQPFLIELIEAQRKFIRTRKYWKPVR